MAGGELFLYLVYFIDDYLRRDLREGNEARDGLYQGSNRKFPVLINH